VGTALLLHTPNSGNFFEPAVLEAVDLPEVLAGVNDDLLNQSLNCLLKNIATWLCFLLLFVSCLSVVNECSIDFPVLIDGKIGKDVTAKGTSSIHWQLPINVSLSSCFDCVFCLTSVQVGGFILIATGSRVVPACFASHHES